MTASTALPTVRQGRARRFREWAFVAAAAGISTALLSALGGPSPVLFGCLFGALVVVVAGLAAPSLPAPLATLAQALLGASTGAIIDPATLAGLVAHAAPVAAAVVATIVVSILIGQVLRLHRAVTAATATFAFIAGGASGITAVATELGADDRVVAVVQYLRVLIIIVGMPVVAAVAFGAPLIGEGSEHESVSSAAASAILTALSWQGLLFTAVSVGVGLLLARLVRFPAANLLGPLLVSAVLAVNGGFGVLTAQVPRLFEVIAFALIGLMVGLRFTRASLVSIARLLPSALALILLLIAISAGFGMLLARWIGVSAIDGYLATTPGGLYAVLVTAGIAGADVTFVLGVQVVRLLLVLALAPVLAAWFRRRASPGHAASARGAASHPFLGGGSEN
ncbi:AbrB family transcriptional regulator [Gephyromycinifex aptenodytis]|uniref:AbrB family transcriptional regulator n=1 Tax=Gephyromycinifex aptenodytis TaxID=2716227 RepID=UPI001445D5D4|nr:AbrB family transcriptional regulator [Gephyromycinifex aptenodytis]